MNGVDFYFSEVLETVIKKKLGARSFNKLKNRLLNQFGISVSQGMLDFDKVDQILHELFSSAAIKIEKEVFKKIIEHIKFDSKQSLMITNEDLIQKTLLSYGDKDKKSILEFLLNNPQIILDVVYTLDIPQATIYRRMKELIRDGFLITSDYEPREDGKNVPTYEPLFERVNLDIANNTQLVVQINDKVLRESSFYKVFQKIHK